MTLKKLIVATISIVGLFATQLINAQGILVLSNTNQPYNGFTAPHTATVTFVPGPTPGGYELTGISIFFGDNSSGDFPDVLVSLYNSNSPLNRYDNFVSGFTIPRPGSAGIYFYSWPTNVFIPAQLQGDDYAVTYYTLALQAYDEAGTAGLNIAYTSSTNYTANAGWSFLPASSGIGSGLGSSMLFNIYATVLPPPVLYPIHMTNAIELPDGSFQFGFTNSPGFSFTTYATTNLALPFTNWFSVGNPLNIGSNYYQYNSGPGVVTSPIFPQVFFRVTSP
jgi:hypothetical protein